MDSFEIREKFLTFFKKNDHKIVPSSSLIPAEDPTLLFANAGMNQFKDVFLGNEKRSYSRATSSQKCLRAGGKHNDLDEVGFTNKHLTFFEMLGNFSFGDYFKKEAIEFGYEFLTEDMGLDKEKLVVSVYKTDDESYEIWNNLIKIPKEKIYKFGEEENFWQMGDTGPCGPCSEIHLDRGKSVGCKTKKCDPSCSCDRFIEIWNLVFMQYNKQQDGTLLPLEQTGVDTGMGLERLCMLVQDKKTIFGTDLFDFLIKRIEELTGKKYSASTPEVKAAFHVLCDHIRSVCLLITDGCSPSNDGRGYVLRKIIRRAALFATKLTDDPTLFPKLSATFIDTMFVAFANLKDNKDLIIKILEDEIDRFASSLEQGRIIFDKYIEKNKAEKKKKISGEQIFKLYDTYGFPPEVTRVLAFDQGFEVDMVSFDKEMDKQRSQSGKKVSSEEIIAVPQDIKTKFVGYDHLESKSKITFIKHEDDSLWIVTEESPFYVESGGQVSDKGFVTINDHGYKIKNFHKNFGDNVAIAIELSVDKADRSKAKKVKIGDVAHCVVDYYKRINTKKNHTATHLLHAALRQVFDKSVKQAGSLVCDEYLRFDYTSNDAMTREQIEQVEKIVNNNIQDDVHLKIFYTSLQDAQDAGVIAFFGEKYDPERVRVVEVPGFSTELCGGTHVGSTGEIGLLKITSDSSLSTGVRRIFAVTGPEAIKLFQTTFSTIRLLCEKYKVKPEQLNEVTKNFLSKHQEALKEIKQMRKQMIKALVSDWISEIEEVKKIPFLFLSLKNYDNDELRTISKELDNSSPGFYFLVSKTDNKYNFFGYVSKGFVGKLDLKDLCGCLKDNFGIRGGGKSDSIQGGFVDVDVDKVKNSIKEWLAS